MPGYVKSSSFGFTAGHFIMLSCCVFYIMYPNGIDGIYSDLWTIYKLNKQTHYGVNAGQSMESLRTVDVLNIF